MTNVPQVVGTDDEISSVRIANHYSSFITSWLREQYVVFVLFPT